MEIKFLVVNLNNLKADDSERALTREEGMSLAQKHNVHFLNVVLKLERMCSNALKNSPQRYLPKTHTFCHLSF
ncbi:hypothetical protein AAG906_034296 [Vitis piasezkii]